MEGGGKAIGDICRSDKEVPSCECCRGRGTGVTHFWAHVCILRKKRHLEEIMRYKKKAANAFRDILCLPEHQKLPYSKESHSRLGLFDISNLSYRTKIL